jgi:hypothetical protein
MRTGNQPPMKYTFSGHESFQCRNLWLKKGYDFVNMGKSFNDEDAVVELGVGKNMVSSIRFWMKAFNLLSGTDELTPLAHKLLSNDGYDPYLEDEGTLWLLHYELVRKGFASSYSIVFNELRREKIEFTSSNFVSFVKRKSEIDKSFIANEKTVSDDFSVLLKMYLRSDTTNKDREETFSGLLTELDLMKSYKKEKEEFYIIENNDRSEIPDEIILYAILDNEEFESSFNINTIEQNKNSIVSIFAINRPGLYEKIETLSKKYPYLVLNDHAGIKELQFKVKPTPESILDAYYAN